jgi:hypothetical protein
VLTGVVRVALKSLAECVRCQTLGRAGYQQLALDIQYLRPRIRRFASAVGRCALNSTDPPPPRPIG